MTEARLDVVIGTAGAVSGGSAVTAAVNQVKHHFIDLSAKVFVAQQALDQVWKMAKGGAEFEETMSRLNRQMGQFNSTGQLMINGLQGITQGQISVERSAMMASRALAAGLNPDQVKTFAGAAELLGDVLGTDIPSAFDQIVQAATSGRAQILANIGVYVDLDEEVKKLAVSTGRTTDQITRQERAMLTAKAIADQTGDAMHRLTDGQKSDADKLNAIQASWESLWTVIEVKSKTAILALVEYNTKLRSLLREIEPSKDTLKSFVPKAFLPMSEWPEFEQNDAVWQGILGRAIVEDTRGNLGRSPTARTEPSRGLPTALRGQQLDAERERFSAGLEAQLDRDRAAFGTLMKLYEIDAQQGLATQEQFVEMRSNVRLKENDAQRDSLQQMLDSERSFYDKRQRIGFESTEERIQEDLRYESKVAEINERMKKTVQERESVLMLNEAEGKLTKFLGEQARGQRIQDALNSEYQIQEAMRQRDLESTEVYYRGQIDMANARFANDQDIAAKERVLLHEQLAFRLRLSREDADRLIFLRQSNNDAGVQDILDRADPNLSLRARQGILDSTTADDILLMERANGDFFAGWARGLQNYTRHTNSAFNHAQDMARRTAQTMEQGFQQLFFRPMEEGFEGFLNGLLDMTKQITSQIAAQLMTAYMVTPLMSGIGTGFSSFFGPSAAIANAAARGAANPALFGPGFASGGVEDFGRGTLTTLHGPEAIVPLPDGRSIPVTMRVPDRAPASSMPPQVQMPVTIINQHAGAEVEAKQTTGSNGMPQLEVLVTKAVNKSLNEGRHDKALRSRFGLVPGER